ncbi:MAG: FAD:protein transferase [Solirubrobacterales bacterium]|nr:FAD:protein transferase [Solirubrobacterales bacterium]
MRPQTEISETFECFGSTCEAFVIGSGRAGSAREASELVRRKLLSWHLRFSRFLADSELSRLNGDPRELVPLSPLMARLTNAVVTAGSLTGGLVDATLIDQIEHAGYVRDLHTGLALADALELAPRRKPAAPASSPGWQQLDVDLAECSVRRPPAVKLDSGGIAKGLFADVLAKSLASHASFAINCAGDIAIGGVEGLTRPVRVESPFDGHILHTFRLERGGIATSGIGRRSWLDADGRPAHHLLDPSTGKPAFTGVVQVTALAPGALMAEVQAKAALLSGPSRAPRWLPHGGVIVFDDGSHQVIDPPGVVTLGQLSAFRQRPRTHALEDA